ncbi:hypothetical protein L3Q82_016434, partial [Scortum barcoo]
MYSFHCQRDISFTWHVICNHLDFLKPALEVNSVSTVQIDVLNKEVATVLRQKSTNVDTVCLAKSVTHNGLHYKCGMILIHGPLGGLPEFCEILQMVILQDKSIFIVKKLNQCGIPEASWLYPLSRRFWPSLTSTRISLYTLSRPKEEQHVKNSSKHHTNFRP